MASFPQVLFVLLECTVHHVIHRISWHLLRLQISAALKEEGETRHFLRLFEGANCGVGFLLRSLDASINFWLTKRVISLVKVVGL